MANDTATPSSATAGAEDPSTGASAAESVIDPVSNVLPDFVDWVPEAVLPFWEIVSKYPIVGSVIIAAVFAVAAFVVEAIIFRMLSSLSALTESSVDDRIAEEFRKPIFKSILFLGLALATKAALLPLGTNFLVNVLASVVVASWMRAILRASDTALPGLEQSSRYSLIEPRTVPLFDLTIKLLTILIGSYVLLLIWGINPIGWLASAGIVGIAVGFAAKDTLANLFSGFFIVADAPYKIGDYINLDSGERGKVSAIGLRSTRLLTRDDVEITIPNGVIANAKIVNESGGPYVKTRTSVAVGAAYGSDVDHVVSVLSAVGRAHSETSRHPEPRVRLRAFGASSLDFDLLVWIEHPEDRGRIRHELLLEVYRTFAKENIEIPYSKQDLYIKEMPRSGANSGQSPIQP